MLSVEGGETKNMTDLVKRDSLQSLMGFPRFFEDFDNLSSQRGLRVYENEGNIIAEAVVAGISAKNVDVDIEDGILSIKAEKAVENRDGNQFTKSSYQYYYTCALSGGQWDKADAEIEDGIVTITIPKTKAARPRKISVKPKSKK